MLRRISQEQGQEIVIAALMLPLLIAFVGLVADVGTTYVRFRKAQNAADAAASAAVLVFRGGSCTSAGSVAAAQTTVDEYAAAHGYSVDQVTLHCPPVSGDYAGQDQYLQVVISDTVKPIYARLVWPGTFTLRARATAGYKMVGAGADVIVLNRTDCDAFSMNGQNTLMHVNNGDVFVNSGCRNYAVDTNNGDIIARGNFVVGGVADSANSTISPEPITGVPHIDDPLAALPEPTGAGCNTYNDPPADGIYLPGVYPNGIDLNNDSVTFDGTSGDCDNAFIIHDQFRVGGNSVITGREVMFFIPEGSEFTMIGTPQMDVTPPPASSTYAGVVIFQDRQNTATATIAGTPTGNGWNGIVYTPAAPLTLSGTGDMHVALIVDLLTVNGNATVNVEGWSGPGEPKIVWDRQVE